MSTFHPIVLISPIKKMVKMKYYYTILFALIFIENNYAQSWKEAYRFNPEQTLHSLDFLDGLVGYTVGALYNGSTNNIHRTTDGGKTWIDQNSGYTGMRFMKVWCHDRDTCYMSSNDGILIKTNDAGSHWRTLLTGTREQIWSMYFTDRNTAYACGSSGLLMKTINAGATWELASNPNLNLLNSIAFLTKEIGFAAGSNILMRTNDAGAHWERVTNFPFTAPADWMRKIIFTSSKIGYICADIGRIFKTEDGGDTWFALNSGTQEALMDMDFVDDQVGVVVGFNGTIMKTIDGGQTWVTMPSPAGIDHNFGIDLIDRKQGFICTHRGKILRIDDLSSGSISYADEDVVVYPAVVKDRLFISQKNNVIHNFIISDAMGNIIVNNKIEHYPLSEIMIDQLPAGVYFITLYSASRRITKSFMKH